MIMEEQEERVLSPVPESDGVVADSVAHNNEEEEKESSGDSVPDDCVVTEGVAQEAETVGDSNPSKAKMRWKMAGRMIMATSHMMHMVMRDRTGAKLLDVQSGDSSERRQIEGEYKELKAYRDHCEKVGRYADVKEATAQMHEIREREDSKRREEMIKNHLADTIKVENAELEELIKTTNLWDKRMDDFQESCDYSEEALQEKHEVEHEALRRRIFGPLEKPKWSTHLLNLRKIQETVAKQQDYDRAIKIQQHADKLQAQEMRVLELEALERHEICAEKLEEKHEQERENFQDRVAFGRRKRETQRSRDMRNLAQRFTNIKRELSLMQEKERTQLEAAINSSLGLGKNNLETDMDGPFEVARAGAEKMRTMQHAYDMNVRFGNKAGNASTITSTMGLSAATNGEQVLGRRRRSGRATLAVGSPSLPQPTTGGPLPFYLKPGAFVPERQLDKLRPSSRCSTAHVRGSDKKTIRTFLQQSKTASKAALDIYRPFSAPVSATTKAKGHFSRPTKPEFGNEFRPRSRGQTAPAMDRGDTGLGDTNEPEGTAMAMYPPQTPPGDTPASPREVLLEQPMEIPLECGFHDSSVTYMAWGDHVRPSGSPRSHKGAKKRSDVWLQTQLPQAENSFTPPDFRGLGTRPPGAGRSSAKSSRIGVGLPRYDLKQARRGNIKVG